MKTIENRPKIDLTKNEQTWQATLLEHIRKHDLWKNTSLWQVRVFLLISAIFNRKAAEFALFISVIFNRKHAECTPFLGHLY